MASDARAAHILTARVPVALEVPDQMYHSVLEVLEGEYEAGYFGENLTILDLGANVGSFSVWATMRWPGSTIHAYEPHPGTFAILSRNVVGLANVRPVNAAVFPTEQSQLTFFGRYDGDGESGVADLMTSTFSTVGGEHTFPVNAIHPRALPAADVIKIDVEGAELDILRHLDISAADLIVLEYQNDANRDAIKALLDADFLIIFEDAVAWDELLLEEPSYHPSLAGDHWGRLFFARRQTRRLSRLAPPRSTAPEPVPVADTAPGTPQHRPLLTRIARKIRRTIRQFRANRFQ